MIKGIGIDIALINRFNPGLVNSILSPSERQLFQKLKNKSRQQEFLAGRFAVKEAIIKATFTPIPLNKISITHNNNGSPKLDSDINHYIPPKTKINKIHLSISHEKNYVIAIAIIEK